jgi:hypothetical protein
LLVLLRKWDYVYENASFTNGALEKKAGSKWRIAFQNRKQSKEVGIKSQSIHQCINGPENR